MTAAESVARTVANKPKALDLFCGAGGVSVGLYRAGFDVTGVDIKAQPNYPFAFLRADALSIEFSGFDFVWASPPCQAHTGMQRVNAARGRTHSHEDLIPSVRSSLVASGVPHVIENVSGSPLRKDLVLCGSMFGLGVRRHRIFESSHLLLSLKCSACRDSVAVYGARPDGRRLWTRKDGSELRCVRGIDAARAAMGIDWMDWDEIKEAIPPAYSEYIGRQFISILES